MGKREKKEKEESRGVPTVWEPFGELGDWWPFGRGRSSHLQGLLRELDEDWPSSFARGAWRPALDIHETDDEYAVTVELAGARKEDVTVECHEGMLTIRGEKKSEREEEKEKRRFVERRYGTFTRSFSLPGDAETEKIDAKFENGVLTLTIPKSEAAKPRTVAVK
jgi:HSP20 family protein